MAIVSVELDNGEVVCMTTDVLAYLIRRRSRMQARMDAEPDSWITLENGEHVPLDANGRAMGGAGGWAEGKDFSSAKSHMAKTAGKAKSFSKSDLSKEMQPIGDGYDFSLEDDEDEFIRKNTGNRRNPKPLYELYKKVESEGWDGIEAVHGEYYKTRLAACTENLHEIDTEKANEILYDNVGQHLADAWFREYNYEVKDRLIYALTQSPEVHNAALNVMYTNYKYWCKYIDQAPLPFDEFLVTPIAMFRGGSGKEYKKASPFSSYTFDPDVAGTFTAGPDGMGAEPDPDGVIYTGHIRPIDTYGSVMDNGEAEILVPLYIAPNGNKDSVDDELRTDSAWDEWLEENLDKFKTDDEQIRFRDWKSRQSSLMTPKSCDDVDEIDMLWDEYQKELDNTREDNAFFAGELNYVKGQDYDVEYPENDENKKTVHHDEEPDSWITVNGNHIPLDEDKNPIGGQQKALGKETASRPKTTEQANKALKSIVKNGKQDDPKVIRDIIEVLRSSDFGTSIKMPESWIDDDGEIPTYHKNENGNWEDIKYGGSISNEEMAYYFAYGAEDPNEMPTVTNFVENEKYVPSDAIQWSDKNKRIVGEELQERVGEIFDDEMSNAIDRARAGLYDGQSQFFGSYMNGVWYGHDSHAAFRSYNYHGDTLINSMCRGSKPRNEGQSKEWAENEAKTKKYIEQMTEVCDKNPLREDAVVFRGLKTYSAVMKALGLQLPEGVKLKDLYEDPDFVRSLEGRTFSDPAFTSTSIDKEFPDKGGFSRACKMEVLLPKGTKGVYFGDALPITDEHEFLLQRGTQFMITSAYVTHRLSGEPCLNLRVAVIGQEPQEIPELKTYKENRVA